MKDTKPFIDDVWTSLENVIQHGFFLCLVVVAPLAGLYFIATTIIDLIK